MTMKKYKVIKAFKGSPNGVSVVSFDKERVVDHVNFGDDLAEVALTEGWVEVVNQDKVEQPVNDDIIAAIGLIDVGNADLWTADGKPTVAVLEDLLDKQVIAEQRDQAWIAFNDLK